MELDNFTFCDDFLTEQIEFVLALSSMRTFTKMKTLFVVIFFPFHTHIQKNKEFYERQSYWKRVEMKMKLILLESHTKNWCEI